MTGQSDAGPTVDDVLAQLITDLSRLVERVGKLEVGLVELTVTARVADRVATAALNAAAGTGAQAPADAPPAEQAATAADDDPAARFLHSIGVAARAVATSAAEAAP